MRIIHFLLLVRSHGFHQKRLKTHRRLLLLNLHVREPKAVKQPLELVLVHMSARRKPVLHHATDALVLLVADPRSHQLRKVLPVRDDRLVILAIVFEEILQEVLLHNLLIVLLRKRGARQQILGHGVVLLLDHPLDPPRPLFLRLHREAGHLRLPERLQLPPEVRLAALRRLADLLKVALHHLLKEAIICRPARPLVPYIDNLQNLLLFVLIGIVNLSIALRQLQLADKIGFANVRALLCEADAFLDRLRPFGRIKCLVHVRKVRVDPPRGPVIIALAGQDFLQTARVARRTLLPLLDVGKNPVRRSDLRKRGSADV